MELTLKMVDQLRSRAGVSFTEAVAVLEKTGGDVVKALLLLEKDGRDVAKVSDELLKEDEKTPRESGVVDRTKKMGVKINKGGRTLTEVPFLLALGTTMFFPKFWAWFVIGLLTARCSLVAGQHLKRNP